MEHQVNNYYVNQDNFNNLKEASFNDFKIKVDLNQVSFMVSKYYQDNNFSFIIPYFIQKVSLINLNQDNSDIYRLNCYQDSFLLI